MSLIIAVKQQSGVLLCSDNVMHEGSDGARMLRLSVPKLWNVSERVAVGMVGAARMRNVLRTIDWGEIVSRADSFAPADEIERAITSAVVPAAREELRDEKAWALFAVGRELFQLSADGSVVALAEPYWTLGCAELVALGALHAYRLIGPSAFDACRAAETAMDAAAQYMSAIVPPWVWAETVS